MKYRIRQHDERWWPEYRWLLRWRPLLDLMNLPAQFGTHWGAWMFIQRAHCNYLNATANRRIKWGRTQEPKISTNTD